MGVFCIVEWLRTFLFRPVAAGNQSFFITSISQALVMVKESFILRAEKPNKPLKTLKRN
jgi:hypothetical protein